MDYYYTIDASGNLCHWGIKGMKWGRRLYQNKDGSLTPLGKKRYAKEEADLKAREKLVKNREREAAKRAKLDAKKAELDAREKALNGGKGKKGEGNAKPDAAPKKKSLSEMSDVELNEAIQRARLEDTYRNLRPEPVAKSSFGKEVLTDVVKPALMNSGRKALEAVIDKSVKDLLKDKADPNSLEAIEAANKKLRAKIENDLLKKGIDPNVKGENLEKWKKFLNPDADDNGASKQSKTDTQLSKGKDQRDDTPADTAPKKEKTDYESWKEGLKNRNEQRKKNKEITDKYEKIEREKAAQEQAEKDRKAAEYQEAYKARKQAADEYIYKKYTSIVPYSPTNSADNARRDAGEQYSKSFLDDYIVVIDRDGSEIFVKRDD